jgi:hypothetical protein
MLELALLCAVPGLKPLGDTSLLGEGIPLGLRGSGGGRLAVELSKGSSKDFCDLCDRASSACGRRPGLRLGGSMLESGVSGRPPNPEKDDWGVSP